MKRDEIMLSIFLIFIYLGITIFGFYSLYMGEILMAIYCMIPLSLCVFGYIFLKKHDYERFK